MTSGSALPRLSAEAIEDLIHRNALAALGVEPPG